MRKIFSAQLRISLKVIFYTILYYVGFNLITLIFLFFFEHFFSFEYLYLANIISLTISLMFAYFIYKRFNKKLTKFKSVKWKQMIWILFVLFAFKILKDPILNYDSIKFGNELKIVGNNNPIIFKLISLLSFSIITPVIEEFIFRGVVLEKLILSGQKKMFSIIYSSFLFSLIHFNPSEIANSITPMIIAFLLGIITAFIYIETRNLSYTIIFHVLNNIFAFIIFSMCHLKYTALIDYFNFDYRYWIIVILAFSGLIYMLTSSMEKNGSSTP